MQSALQRMREAFDGLRRGRLDPGTAQDLFLVAYDDLLDVTSILLMTRRSVPVSRPGAADRD